MQALARMRARPVYKGSQRVSAHLLLCTVAGNVLCIMQVGTISALAPFQLLAHRF